MQVKVKDFGTVNQVDYKEIFIEKEGSFRFSFSDLGARINSWQVPNSRGEFESIILGVENAEQAFAVATYHYGTTVGRVAGRIANGRFDLNGKNYSLPTNDDKNHLHGGDNSFDLQRWDFKIEEFDDRVAIIFELNDKDLTNGYPGNLWVQVTHTITINNEWTISYKAKSDQTTLFNPTNHVYFNLNGSVAETIENHLIQIKADEYLPLDGENIPTGDIQDVAGTAFDLRKNVRFGDLIETNDRQFTIHKGFDHAFILGNDTDYHGVIRVPDKQRELYFYTDEPVVVIYTHNYTPFQMKIGGEEVQKYAGITLEAQKEPDAINHPHFSSIVLEKGRVFESQTKYWLKNESKGAE